MRVRYLKLLQERWEGGVSEVRTVVYFVRHAESVFVEGQERIRGLSDKGKQDALSIMNILKDEEINVFISSPYKRAVDTIRPLADSYGFEIVIEEDLKERNIGEFSPTSFIEAKRQVYDNFSFTFPQGESSIDAQSRAVNILSKILGSYTGQRIVIGTHGDIMTLMINFFDKSYGFDFWQSTSMPDVYRMEFEDLEMIDVKRLYE